MPTAVRRCLAAVLLAHAAAAAGDAPTRVAAAALTGERLAGLIQYVRWPGEADVRRWDVCTTVAPPDGELPPARGRPVAWRRIAAGESIDGCHILDLSGLPPASGRSLLQRARRLPVVTVGEGEGFCTAGGVICTRAASSGGGFEVNLTALQDAGLNANAQLLMLGRRRQTAGVAP